METRSLAIIWFVGTLSFWIYYTMWIMVSPLIDANHSFQNYFPDRKWGIVIPIMLGVGVLVITLTFAGIALLMDTSIQDEVSKRIDERQSRQEHSKNGGSRSALNRYRMHRFHKANGQNVRGTNGASTNQPTLEIDGSGGG